jgi:sugar-specific transcriptional regulator TrmB
MSEFTHSDLLRLTQKLQNLNLSGYEARTYLALVRFGPSRGPELALRAEVPRQKIYDVLDSLAAKGFADVIADKPRLYAAVEPVGALGKHWVRKRQESEAWLAEQRRLIEELRQEMETLAAGSSPGPEPAPTVRLIADREEAAARFRQLLGEVQAAWLQCGAIPWMSASEYAEALLAAAGRGAACRVLLESSWGLDWEQGGPLLLSGPDVEIRSTRRLPLQLAIGDDRRGLVGFNGGALWFEHEGLGAALAALFEDFWRHAAAATRNLSAEGLERPVPQAMPKAVE